MPPPLRARPPVIRPQPIRYRTASSMPQVEPQKGHWPRNAMQHHPQPQDLHAPRWPQQQQQHQQQMLLLQQQSQQLRLLPQLPQLPQLQLCLQGQAATGSSDASTRTCVPQPGVVLTAPAVQAGTLAGSISLDGSCSPAHASTGEVPTGIQGLYVQFVNPKPLEALLRLMAPLGLGVRAAGSPLSSDATIPRPQHCSMLGGVAAQQHVARKRKQGSMQACSDTGAAAVAAPAAAAAATTAAATMVVPGQKRLRAEGVVHKWASQPEHTDRG